MNRIYAAFPCMVLAGALAVSAVYGQTPAVSAPVEPVAVPAAKKGPFNLSQEIDRLKQKLPFRVQGRRDPFESPIVGKSSGPAVQVLEETQKKLIDSAENIKAKIIGLKSQGNFASAVKEAVGLREQLKKQTFTVPAYKQKAREITDQLQLLLTEMAQAWKNYMRQEAAQALQELEQSFKQRDYQAVVDGVEIFRDNVRDVAAVSEEVKGIVQAADKLAQRANVHLEFEGIQITISGLICVPGGGGLAIINGKDVQDIPPDNKVTVQSSSGPLTLEVKSIGREEVVFLYKGELISATLYE